MTKSGKHCDKRRKSSFRAISSFVTIFSKSCLLQRRQKVSKRERVKSGCHVFQPIKLVWTISVEGHTMNVSVNFGIWSAFSASQDGCHILQCIPINIYVRSFWNWTSIFHKISFHNTEQALKGHTPLVVGCSLANFVMGHPRNISVK